MKLKKKLRLPKKTIQILIAGAIVLPLFVFAASSANYRLEQDSGGSSVEWHATSTNYQFDAQIGHPGVGTSTSANYIFTHGAVWLATSTVTATIQWAVPEVRSGAAGTNDDVRFYLTVRNPVNHAYLATSTMATTSADGTYATPLDLTNIYSGTYDVGIKTAAHLTKILRNADLKSGNTVLNFTQTDNSAPKGAIALVAGDINGTGDSPATFGDNVVNSVDLSSLINDLNNNNSDPTGNYIRSNINQDTAVNSVDLSLMISNLDETGDI